MTDRLQWIPLEQALSLGREMGIAETQASRGAFRTIANNPEVARSLYGLLTTLLHKNQLPLRLREWMVLRIAWTTGSEYAWAQHYRIATTQAGFSEADVLAVRDWKNSDRPGPAERAVLAAVDDTVARGCISDAVWAECALHIREPALLVEMAVGIGNWIMLSQLFQTFKVPLQEGAASWPPDGEGPQRAV